MPSKFSPECPFGLASWPCALQREEPAGMLTERGTLPTAPGPASPASPCLAPSQSQSWRRTCPPTHQERPLENPEAAHVNVHLHDGCPQKAMEARSMPDGHLLQGAGDEREGGSPEAVRACAEGMARREPSFPTPTNQLPQNTWTPRVSPSSFKLSTTSSFIYFWLCHRAKPEHNQRSNLWPLKWKCRVVSWT